tara:strand:- start:130 stop:291 length:162 start_codon:yes stop_codon:yes gene_type:complete
MRITGGSKDFPALLLPKRLIFLLADRLLTRYLSNLKSPKVIRQYAKVFWCAQT